MKTEKSQLQSLKKFLKIFGSWLFKLTMNSDFNFKEKNWETKKTVAEINEIKV
jgi:hypothetical protein